MNKKIDRIKKIRLFLLDLVHDLTLNQLNKIPLGFSNNIIWNLGHLIAAQQGVCYARAVAKPVVDEKYILAYKPGTKPEQHVDAKEVEIIKSIFLSSLDQLEIDYQNKEFTNYSTWSTRYGTQLTNIDDAIEFLMYHEGLHAGAVIALKRLVNE